MARTAMQQFDTPELAAFRYGVRAWVEANSPRGWRDNFVTLSDADRRAFLAIQTQKLRSGGYLAPHWPIEFGGGERSAAEQVVLKQELYRGDFPPVGGGIAFHHAAATIIKFGTPEQQKHLAAILDGEVWCQGFSEPNAGSDLAALRTRAARDGDVYLVNGQKVWSSGAMHSTWCLLLARTDPDAPKHKGISVFLLDLRSPGVEIRPIRQATGSSEFCEIFLTDVRIPVENRLGPENEGWRIANTTLSTERGSFIVENHAALVDGLAMLAAEAGRTPVGAGRMASEDPAIRQELADRAAEIDVLGMLTEKVIGSIVRHGEMGPESSILKLFYSETLQKFTDLAARIRGIDSIIERPPPAFGYITGDWLIDHIRSWTWTIAAGSNEIQRNIIGERVLGLPREPALN